MTKIAISLPRPVCHCGNNHESFDAALRLARLAVGQDRQPCTVWQLSVAHSFVQVIKALYAAKMVELHQSGEMYQDLTMDQMGEQLVGTDHRLYAAAIGAQYKNTDLHDKLVKFLCDDCGITPEAAEEGAMEPDEETLERVGLKGHLIGEGDGLEALAAILGLFRNDPDDGSKTH